MDFYLKNNRAQNVVQYQTMRQTRESFSSPFMRKLQVTTNLLTRIGLEAELKGHTGCVNCLEWNDTGELLASGSDDLQIMLWEPFRRQRLASMPNTHSGNIFSLKFFPHSNDRKIISCAADCKVRIFDIEDKEILMDCNCHYGRVKRLTATSNVPHLFWSAAEDGMILQYDLRENHQCSVTRKNVLINVAYHSGKNTEAKCIAVNPLQPELLAVGANDPYVRLYDRRMIKLTDVKCIQRSHSTPGVMTEENTKVAYGDDNLPLGCVSYFVPGHLPVKQGCNRKKYRILTSTYVAFSPDGNDILANLGGEQIYLYNIKSKKQLLNIVIKDYASICKQLDCDTSDKSKPGCSSQSESGAASKTPQISKCINALNRAFFNAEFPPLDSDKEEIPPPTEERFEKIVHKGNYEFGAKQYSIAINIYSYGITQYPEVAVLYDNRALAYLKREWNGDIYAAMRDCYSAIRFDPKFLAPYLNLVQCLLKLSLTEAAQECFMCVKERFQNPKDSKEIEEFEKGFRKHILTFNDPDFDDSDDGELTYLQSPKAKRRMYNAAKALMILSPKERYWRSNAFDYETRFCGHCNTTTDIKEANFFGSEGQFIVAGSDDGSIFFWDRKTAQIVRILRGDDSIVNCCQPHFSTCLVATSGIDPVVRLWAPRPDDGSLDGREVRNSEDAASANQRRMNADPLEDGSLTSPDILKEDDAFEAKLEARRRKMMRNYNFNIINLGYAVPKPLQDIMEDSSENSKKRPAGPDTYSISYNQNKMKIKKL